MDQCNGDVGSSLPIGPADANRSGQTANYAAVQDAIDEYRRHVRLSLLARCIHALRTRI